MSKHIYTKQYQETGIPKGPEVVKHVKTDARPDVDGTPDGPAEGPAKPEEAEKLREGTGPAAEGK